MLSKNILIFIGVLILVGIVVYFYYDFSSEPVKKNSITKSRKKPRKKPNKKVRFDNKIQYNEYSNDNPISNHNAASDEIDIDSIIDESSNIEIEFDEHPEFETNSLCAPSKIMPSNLDQTNPDDAWDASFGLPLMSKEEKKDYFNRMQKNFQKYGRALGDFYKYQTDRSTVITTETTIDPFKPDHRSATLMGRPIKEIFDAQVSGPKAKPKQVKKRTANQTIYENEDVMNGGTVPGTNNLHGFQGYEHYKSAAFGNEF